MGRKARDLLGQRFGRLVVIQRAEAFHQTTAHALWLCECDCGNTHYARGSNLTTGHTKRCRHCADANLDGAPASKTVVRVWCTAAGEGGGFAEALDPQGAHILHTHWSLQPLKFSPIGRCRLVRRAMTLLHEAGRIRIAKTRESVVHWAKATGVDIQVRMFTPEPILAAKWFEIAGL
jgi:hypothetical protein